MATNSIERILCPTDLSSQSLEALRYAVTLAHTYSAKLYVCYCTELSPVTSGSLSRTAVENVKASFINSIIEHLGHADFAQIDWEGLVIEEGNDLSEALATEAASRRVDMIVMRSRRRPHRAALLGSTAEALCRTAPCPVLVTHPQEREWVVSATGKIDLRRVLVAYDFSDDSERALNYAFSLAQEYQSEFHLLHVLPKPPDEPEFMWTPSHAESLYQRAMERLRGAVTEEGRLLCEVRHALRWGKPYQEILAYAREQEIDVIAMGASGRNFGTDALFGSNVDRVLRQAPCPILIARPLRPASAFYDK
jgi:nucleotide-binding universal stress UspA family protein